MKPELTTEDKERIEQEAERVYHSNANDLDYFSVKQMLRDVAEYATLYEREQHEQSRKDAYDAGLMCQRILDKDKIEQLEAERSELRSKVIEWIDVKDRLPDKLTFVIVYGPFVKALPLGCIDEENEWRDIDEMLIKVTHWMPLPQPPKN